MGAVSSVIRNDGRGDGEDERFAFGAAIATLILGLFLACALLLVAGNLIFLLVSGATPNVPFDSGASPREMWRGLFPVPLPWWVFLIAAAGWVVVLALNWTPERWMVRMVGPLRLIATPVTTAILSILTAIAALTWSMWIADGYDARFGIPIALLLGVSVAALLRFRVINRAPAPGASATSVGWSARSSDDEADG